MRHRASIAHATCGLCTRTQAMRRAPWQASCSESVHHRAPKNILVPVDFGEASQAALDYAVDLAEGTDAKVFVLHTFEIPIVGLPDGVVAATAELTGRIVNAAQKALLEQGDAREVILAEAKELGADLIVIGTHGRRGIARALIGSVAESVVRTSPVPVLTVHAPG